MLPGTEIAAALNAIDAMRPSVIGLNCATDTTEMGEHLRHLSQHARMPISVLPNAGLPSVVDGQMHYDLGPDEFGRLERKPPSPRVEGLLRIPPAMRPAASFAEPQQSIPSNLERSLQVVQRQAVDQATARPNCHRQSTRPSANVSHVQVAAPNLGDDLVLVRPTREHDVQLIQRARPDPHRTGAAEPVVACPDEVSRPDG